MFIFKGRNIGIMGALLSALSADTGRPLVGKVLANGRPLFGFGIKRESHRSRKAMDAAKIQAAQAKRARKHMRRLVAFRIAEARAAAVKADRAHVPELESRVLT